MNITSFRIIDSTLREGEQFALAHFTIEQKLAIAAPRLPTLIKRLSWLRV